MPFRLTENPEYKQWRLLLVYDLYRFISIGLFLGLYLYDPSQNSHYYSYCSILALYFLSSLIILSLWRSDKISFDFQVVVSGTIDVVAVSSMLSIIGNLQSGNGILLNVTIAALSILAPGRLAIFFAALASCLLLCGNIVEYFFHNQKDLGTFYYSGIYGAGFFATALTAWYLANWVRVSEDVAQHRSNELAGMQRINEYIVERLRSGIIYVDFDKQIKLMNSAARHYFRVDEKETPEQLQDLSVLLAEKFDNFLNKAKHDDSTAQSTLEEPYLMVHFFSTAVSNNPEVLIILEDMTYISQQAQQLKLASLGRFSASIAHELRNPLGAIAHAVQLLGEGEELNKEDNRLKQLIVNNCERMNRVIKNVLQLSRRQNANAQLIDMGMFLEQFKQDFAHLNDCELNIKTPKTNTFSAVFDKSQLEQILIILCDNAMQHGRNKEGKVSIDISLNAQKGNSILKISDSGPGIPAEIRDAVFEPFFTTLRSGTGMGLFIARDLCEINQARISLEQSKKGASFIINLNSSSELLI